MDRCTKESDLLFGVFAVQLGFLTPAQLQEASAAADGPLGAWFEQRGILTSRQRRIVERRLAQEARYGAEETISEGSQPQAALEAARMVDDAAPTVAAPTTGSRALHTPSVPAPESGDEEADEHVTLCQPGRYTIRSVHGRGGQARVLLAFDEHIGREVAIKELLTGAPTLDGSTPPSLQRSTPGQVRFLREARVTGQLEHPNIVPVHEVGRREDGTLYYSMRLVNGQTLAKRLKTCKTLADRVKLLGAFWDVCNAIAFAHSRGVVHRDIKPENVMVGEFGETVVLDWGVAKVRGQRDIRAHDIEKELRLFQKAESGYTADGTAIGTPSYMSPEQAKGEIEAIDERSDVWGLGAVLYELLTGRPPYRGETPMDTILQVGNDPLLPVAARCPDAPPELAAVAEKALQKNRAARYGSAKELSEEVSAYMTGARVGAYHYSSWELLKRFAAQNKATIIAAGLILAVIIGALVSVSLSLRAETQARLAEGEAHGRAEAARSQEQAERRLAHFHLAQAYDEKSDRLMREGLSLSTAIFAAASLQHNPAHPLSPHHDPGFAAVHPGARELQVRAASTIYRLRFDLSASLERSLQTGEVLTRVTFLPDGRLAAAGFERNIQLWDADRGQQLARLEGHTDQIFGLAASPDGRWLASADRGGSIRLWHTADGKLARSWLAHPGAQVNCLVFSPDGRTLASAGWDGAVRLWEVETNRPHPVLLKHPGKVHSVAFSPDGRRLASAGSDGAIRLWDIARAKPLNTLTSHDGEVFCVRFSPDGRRLASGGDDYLVRLWSAASGRLLTTLKGHTDGVLALAFDKKGHRLASAGYDHTLRLWEIPLGRTLLALAGHRDFVTALAFSPDGSRLASCGYDRVVRLWRLEPGEPLVRLRGHTDAIYGVRYSPDGRLLATAGWDRTVRLWDAASGRGLKVLRGHEDVVDNLAFSPDGRTLVSTSRDRTARVWDVASGACRQVLRGHGDTVYGVAFSPDGLLLATASADASLRIWDAADGQLVLTIRGHEATIDNIAYAPDGRTLASAGYDRTVRIWDPRTGQQLRVLGGHSDWISGLDFAPDGSWLASSGKDGLTILWDTQSGLERRRLVGHRQWVNSVRISRDGKLLASASDDRSVRLWDTETGEDLLILGASREVVAIDFSADSQKLAIGDGEEVRLYPVDFSALRADPSHLLTETERRAGLRLDGFDLVPGEGNASP